MNDRTRPTFYLTTPIYYANARPHVGSAYTTLVADTIARFKRMQGYDVTFLTGTDEHGENIARAAAKLGITPRELVDRNSAVFRALWDELGISYTRFIRTTSGEHLRAVRRLLLRARDTGYIYKSFYEGRYCVHDNLYVTDNTDPVDCPLCGRPAEIVSEENHFFKLSAFQDKLLKLYQEQPDFIRPGFRRNEIVRFVESGLRDISVSRRTVKWGLPWPMIPSKSFTSGTTRSPAISAASGTVMMSCSSRNTGRRSSTSSAKKSSAFIAFIGLLS